MFDIKKQLMWSKLKVGVVVTAALFILLLTVFFAGSIESLFSPKIDVYAQIKDVRGLRNGSPVWFAGVEVGFVKNIQLHAQHGTLVTLAINKGDTEFIGRDAIATVMTMGLLGDKYVEISNGEQSKEYIKPGDVLKGKVQLEIKDIVDATAESLSKVTGVIQKLGTFVEKIDKSEGSLGKFVNDPSLYNNLKESTRALSAGLKEYETSNGTLRQFIKDPALYTKMSDAASSLSDFSSKLNSGNGSLQRLISDPSMYDNLDKASRRLSEVLDGIESGRGVAGSLVKDEELARQVKESVAGLNQVVLELKELTKDVKEHPKKYFKFSIF
ncbi:MAG TPA: MlaD family protein [Dissulfurispiraceae bacterium]|nr:MlaD family protein [Dissulfurispiraceae bacterium]